MGRTCGMCGGEENLRRGIWLEDVRYRLEDLGIDGKLRGRLIGSKCVACSSGNGDYFVTSGVTIRFLETVLQELDEGREEVRVRLLWP